MLSLDEYKQALESHAAEFTDEELWVCLELLTRLANLLVDRWIAEKATVRFPSDNP